MYHCWYFDGGRYLVGRICFHEHLRLHIHLCSVTEVAELSPCILLFLFIKASFDYEGSWSEA